MAAIRLIVKVPFTNPKTGLKLKVGEVVKVKKESFWLRRLQAGDCEVYSEKIEAKEMPLVDDVETKKEKPSKGSK